MVQDTGVGMSEEVKARAFEPFFTTKKAKGTGLGLSLCATIISRMGGEVLLESTEGLGTTITLSLPASVEDAEAAAGPARRGRRRKAHGAVLVVDDDRTVLELLAEHLKEYGLEVRTTTSPLDALQLLEGERFDVVVTDLAMPDLSGFELAERVKTLSPSTPVILVTGWGIEVHAEDLRRAGIDVVLYKPFRREEVAGAVERFLHGAARRA